MFDFGSTDPGSTIERQLMVTNSGNLTLDLQPITDLSAQFSWNASSISLPAGTSEQIDAEFSPLAAGNFSSTFEWLTNDVLNDTLFIDFVGIGTDTTNTTGITDAHSSFGLLIYPQPAFDWNELNIVLPNSNKLAKMYLSTINGQVCAENIDFTGSISTTSYSSFAGICERNGQYILNFIFEDGTASKLLIFSMIHSLSTRVPHTNSRALVEHKLKPNKTEMVLCIKNANSIQDYSQT